VLEDVNFSVGDGEFLSILGPFRLWENHHPASADRPGNPGSRSILKDGREITSPSLQSARHGQVFQNYALFENMTVLDNVAYAMRKRPDMRKRAAETAMDIAARLWGLKSMPPGVRGGCPAVSSSGWHWPEHWRCAPM
jgi:ABC-type Fe3+/spermidine/putrescine transport system ATPase subunit